MQVHVVNGLGFGDEGKGALVAALSRRIREETGRAPLVVRFNGGAQAGHNVTSPAGDRHTFSSFGSGTFEGAPTYLSEHFVFHPGAFGVERKRLKALGFEPRVSISPSARVTTPYHTAANRIRETARGRGRHGSCGVGVGETARLDAAGWTLTVWDLRFEEKGELAKRFEFLRDVYYLDDPVFRAEFEAVRANPSVREEIDLFERPVSEVLEAFRAQAREALEGASIRLSGDLPEDRALVFEGAQGVLLDEFRGTFPYCTRSRTTSENALQILQSNRVSEVPVRWGIVRSYLTRHGAGPFPTETDDLADLAEPDNVTGSWQGAFRRGWLDLPLLRYALAANFDVDRLAVTHLDRVEGNWRVATRYAKGPSLVPGPLGDYEHLRTRITEPLSRAVPVYEGVTRDSVLRVLSEGLGAPIGGFSTGPAPKDWVFTDD